MTAPTRCFTCHEPVLVVALPTCTRTVEPEPDDKGTVEVRVRRSGLSRSARITGANTPPHPGYVKHRTHSCKQPMEASA